MRTKYIFISLLIILVAIFITKSLSQSTSAPHGGKVKQAGNYNIEMKHADAELYAFLLDNKLNPINNKDVTCDARLYFPDSSTVDVIMIPFGKDGFKAEPASEYFNSCKITFHLSGNNVSAEFENETLLVNKK